jgi:hypothetical protein
LLLAALTALLAALTTLLAALARLLLLLARLLTATLLLPGLLVRIVLLLLARLLLVLVRILLLVHQMLLNLPVRQNPQSLPRCARLASRWFGGGIVAESCPENKAPPEPVQFDRSPSVAGTHTCL